MKSSIVTICDISASKALISREKPFNLVFEDVVDVISSVSRGKVSGGSASALVFEDNFIVVFSAV